MAEFVKLTCPDGRPLYVKRSMIAVVVPFRGVTHVVLTNEDVDYEVRETPEQVMREVHGDGPRHAVAGGDAGLRGEPASQVEDLAPEACRSATTGPEGDPDKYDVPGLLKAIRERYPRF